MSALRHPGRTIHVGYSTNVHRAESVAEVLAFLDAFTVPVKERLLPAGAPLGLDLRLGSALAHELSASPDATPALREALDARGLYVFGVNGFPLGDFQAPVVKSSVYRPDWTEASRLEDTLAIGRILAALLPDHVAEGAVSTVAGAYRPHRDSPEARDAMAEALVRAAAAFAALSEETGRTIVLAPEPEPDTTLDVCASIVAFYRDHVWPAARRQLGDHAEAIVYRHLPVCLDACHLSVAFETPHATVTALECAGIRVGKANVSCCPAVRNPAHNEAGRRFLAALDEPRFLHQTWGADASGHVCLKLADLGDFGGLDAAALAHLAEVRSHFHVPLFLEGGEGFITTRDETEAFTRALLSATDCIGFAVETYTWHVLGETPIGNAADEGLIAGLTEELRWAMARLAPPADADRDDRHQRG